jgi:hypothetical protein
MPSEFFTEEGCFITELHNTEDDPAVSVARARVEPGVRTALHAVVVEERYLGGRGDRGSRFRRNLGRSGRATHQARGSLDRPDRLTCQHTS